MTKKGKNQLSAGLIVLSLGALAVDKLILSDDAESGPNPTEAAELTREAPSGSSLLSSIDTRSGAAATEFLLDRRLEEYEAMNPHRDPFVLSAAMWARLSSPNDGEDQEEDAAQASERPQDRAEEFQAANRLHGVLQCGSASMAIVNGLTVRLGESVDGLILVSVGVRSATFERDDVRVTLSIPIE